MPHAPHTPGHGSHVFIVLKFADSREFEAMTSHFIVGKTNCSRKKVRLAVSECTCRHAATMRDKGFCICDSGYFEKCDASCGLDQHEDLNSTVKEVRWEIQ